MKGKLIMSTENDNLTDSLQYVRRQVNAIVAAFFDQNTSQTLPFMTVKDSATLCCTHHGRIQ